MSNGCLLALGRRLNERTIRQMNDASWAAVRVRSSRPLTCHGRKNSSRANDNSAALCSAGAIGRGRVKTQKYSVFRGRFTPPGAPPSQHSSIWRVVFLELRAQRAFSHGLGHQETFIPRVAKTFGWRLRLAIRPSDREGTSTSCVVKVTRQHAN